MTNQQPAFIEPAVIRGKSIYDIVAVAFCALLLISNIGAVKLIDFGGNFITDGGALLFPLTYILGDVLAEVYGLKAATRTILLGFGVSILASLSFILVDLAPALDEEVGNAFSTVLGFLPRIVLASMCGYLVGQFLNAYVLVRMKQRFGSRRLWVRLLGSTIVGEAADTIVFCTVAFIGEITGGELLSYIALGFVWKVGIEAVMLPVTYQVIKFVKKRESIPVATPAVVGGN